MTNTTNGWSGKPGVPMNPEKDGWHWVKSALTGEEYLFNWKAGKFWSCGQPQILPHWVGHPMWQVREMIYLGPCFTPDQATALQARVAELEGLVSYLCGRNTDHVQVALVGNPIVADAVIKRAEVALEGKKT